MSNHEAHASPPASHPTAGRAGQVTLFGMSPGGWLYLIMGLYAALCLAYNLSTPIGEGPDEVDHIRYVEHIVRYGRLPAIGSEAGERPYTIEAKQPPTYYLIQAGAMLAFGRGGNQLVPEMETDRAFRQTGVRFKHPPVPAHLLPWTYIMRVFGMLAGLATIALVYAGVREVFPDEERAPIALAAASLGLLPQFIFMSSVVNNDHLAIVVGAAISYLMLRILMRGVRWSTTLLLGAMLGLALISKTNLLAYIPIGLLVLVLALPGLPEPRWRGDARRAWRAFARQRAPYVGAALAALFLVGGWWPVSNFLRYGDLLGSSAVQSMAQQVFPQFVRGVNPGDPAVFFEKLIYTIDTHLGWPGWESLRLPSPFYWGYYALLLLATGALVFGLVRKEFKGWRHVCMLLAVLMCLLFYFSLIVHGAWRGRLLFPVLPMFGLLVAVGTHRWITTALRGRDTSTSAWATALLWIIFLLTADLVALLGVMLPAYYPG